MSDPVIREQIMKVMREKRTIEACTRAELKAAFGLQCASNRQFKRALGSLAKNKQLRITSIDAYGDRGHGDYHPCVVSLYCIDQLDRDAAQRRLLRRYEERVATLQIPTQRAASAVG